MPHQFKEIPQLMALHQWLLGLGDVLALQLALCTGRNSSAMIEKWIISFRKNNLGRRRGGRGANGQADSTSKTWQEDNLAGRVTVFSGV